MLNNYKFKRHQTCGLRRKAELMRLNWKNNTIRTDINQTSKKREKKKLDILKEKRWHSMNISHYSDLKLKESYTGSSIFDWMDLEEEINEHHEPLVNLRRARSLIRPIVMLCPPAPKHSIQFLNHFLKKNLNFPNYERIDESSEESDHAFDENSPETCESMWGML